MKKFSAADRQPRKSSGKIQPLLLLLMGLGFVVLGLRIYPAFVAVGGLFLIISYRGYTCRTSEAADRE